MSENVLVRACAVAELPQSGTLGVELNGIPLVIVRGFFGEIIAKIAVPAVRERLTDAIEDELALTESIQGTR